MTIGGPFMLTDKGSNLIGLAENISYILFVVNIIIARDSIHLILDFLFFYWFVIGKISLK